jgi:hypothetical protein
VDESEAVFVGTLVERREGGLGGPGNLGAIYTFEVETWVKGDLGQVIEVHSGVGDGDCGYAAHIGDRVGAFITRDGDHLTGSSCAQVDPDVLLAAMKGPVTSATGIAYLLTAGGWASTRLSVLDEGGGQVAEVFPPGGSAEPSGTLSLDVCPGGELMLQLTSTELVVWDLRTLETAGTHDISNLKDGWVSDISCREADASSIWALVAGEFDSELVEVLPEQSTLLDLPGNSGHIGTDYIISQVNGEGDVTWVDVTTGERTALTETPPGELRSISVGTHPLDSRIALVETRFKEIGPVTATLTIIDGPGDTTQQFDIPWETYSPTWLDETRVTVRSYDFDDWEQSFGFVFDLTTGETTEIEDWKAEHVIADGDTLYGVIGGSIVSADLGTGAIETLVTLPTQTAGPLVLLDAATTIDPSSTTTSPSPDPTTPPLFAPGLGGPADSTTYRQWVAGGAIAAFLGMLVWLTWSHPKRRGPS